jgi:hypothetical protein
MGQLCNFLIFLSIKNILRYSTLLYATLRYSTLLYATLCYSTLLYSTLFRIKKNQQLSLVPEFPWLSYNSPKSSHVDFSPWNNGVMHERKTNHFCFKDA